MLAFALILCLIWLTLIWYLTRHDKMTFWIFLVGVFSSMIAVFVVSPSLRDITFSRYEGDSFFTLDAFGRSGVLAISTTCILLFFGLIYLKTRWIMRRTPSHLAFRLLSVLLDSFAGCLLFGVLYSASPQIYYTFYRIIIPSLPNQVVIKTFFDWDRLMLILSLDASETLSHHLAGVCLLAIIPFTFWCHARSLPSTIQKWGLMLFGLLCLWGAGQI